MSLENCREIQLPSYSGIYFLFKGTVPVYVGQAKNVMRRIVDHFKDKDFDTVKVLAVPERYLNPVEWYWIRKLEPKLNRRSTSVSWKMRPKKRFCPDQVGENVKFETLSEENAANLKSV